MGLLRHYDDDENISYDDLEEWYIQYIENCELSSLAEIRNVHLNSEYMDSKQFCEYYGLVD